MLKSSKSTKQTKHSATLPLHNRPVKRLQFEDQQSTEPQGAWNRWTARLFKKLTSPSTGSPSDGLGGAEGSESSAGVSFVAGQKLLDSEKEGEDWSVDEVVVSAELDGAGAGASGWRPGGTTTASERQSDSGGSIRDADLTHRAYLDDHRDEKGVWSFLRHRVWPVCYAFFDPRFESPEREDEFQKQVWYGNKRLATALSLFLILNWILYLVLNHMVGDQLYESITYYGPFTLFTLPVPFMVAVDMPRRSPAFFQTWLAIATWYCGWTEIIQIKECGFYRLSPNNCNHKDFLAMLYYCTGLPALSLFTVATRFYTALAQIVTFILISTLIIPDQVIFARNLVAYALFSIFILGLHYSREMNERQMFILNSQLKLAYRSQQKAQIAESHANNSKRRFVSYIFHEVRVPLNTAMLAFQNLRSGEAFIEDERESHATEIHALEASLSMMQQVLDDVLDLQRMDAGRFESSPRPFPLHRAINSMLGNVRVATSAKHLNLIVDLDEKIDQLQDPASGEKHLWIVGDEMRLRQVVTNLSSNATKFTPEYGGTIKVVTKLLKVIPASPPMKLLADGSELPTPTSEQVPRLVFRFEVHDSGPGVRPSDIASSRLFTPFAQTNVGKYSGTKGSGLGLAIVKQIITLSGGRLGVQSRKGSGSCFWFELAYRIASEREIRSEKEDGTGMMGPMPSPPVTMKRPPLAVLPDPPRGSFASSTYSEMSEEEGTVRLRMGPTMPMAMARSGGTAEPAVQPSPASLATGSYLSPAMSYSSRPLLPNGSAEQEREKAGLGPPAVNGVKEAEPKPNPPIPNGRPVAAVADAAPSTSSSSLPVPVSSPPVDPLRVLVVDDDPLTRTLMTRMLSRLGCAIETADDGQQALDILLPQDGPDKRFDLVSLDNAMPILSGEETVRRLRAAGRTDLVVGCTGNALASDQKSYLAAGADRVLTKPIMLKDLKAMLQIAAQRREEEPDPQPGPTRSESQ